MKGLCPHQIHADPDLDADQDPDPDVNPGSIFCSVKAKNLVSFSTFFKLHFFSNMSYKKFVFFIFQNKK